MTTEKICPKCKALKPADEFYKNTGRPDGLSSYCKPCQIGDASSRYTKHPRWKAPDGMKKCYRCKEIKPLDDFGANRSTHDGYQGYCKGCAVATVTASRHKDPTSHRQANQNWRQKNITHHADINAKWKYGVPHGTYDKMFLEQSGVCAICKLPSHNGHRLHIDHCHDTGKVRDLLCTSCNNGIGRFRHKKELLLEAAAYLERHA